jgi:hypothetical protein
MRPPPEQTPPLLYGPDDVTEGYYELEELERAMTLEALRKHREPVAFWYRALTLYRRGMIGEWDFSDAGEEETKLTVWGLQSQLLGLGVSSTKAALDMLLAGYYSVAYAAIRHMLETFVQYLYVAIAPDEAKRWYKQPGGLEAQSRTPGCRFMVDEIKQRPDLAPPDFMEKVYTAWALMSKGAHPTGEGIHQTAGDEEGRFFVIGAAYDRDFCLTGFDHGLFAIDNLLVALVGLRKQSDEWQAKWEALRPDVSHWRESTAELQAGEGRPAG